MNRKELITELAKFIVRQNLNDYKNSCICEEVAELKDVFVDYGVNTETVKIYLDQFTQEVFSEVKNVQSTLADILYED